MLINAQIIKCESREIETVRGKQILTELYIIDADIKKNFYVGLILGERAYSYKENEIVTFQASVSVRNKRLCMILTPEEAEGAS